MFLKPFDLKKPIILVVSGEQNWRTGVRDSRENSFSFSSHLCLSTFVFKYIYIYDFTYFSTEGKARRKRGRETSKC